MPISYPAGLPQYPKLGHTEGLPNNVLRTQTDTGPPQTRRLSSSPTHPVQMVFQMTQAEKVTFFSWYTDTLLDGSQEFEHFMPDAPGTTVVFQFDESPPKMQSLSSNLWKVTMNLLYKRVAP